MDGLIGPVPQELLGPKWIVWGTELNFVDAGGWANQVVLPEGPSNLVGVGLEYLQRLLGLVKSGLPGEEQQLHNR